MNNVSMLRRVLIKEVKPHVTPPPCTSHTPPAEHRKSLTPSLDFRHPEQGPAAKTDRNTSRHSLKEGHQLSCMSLTKRTVCCPPLDAISTARFSSCLPVIFTGLHSSSSSPVPSWRLVPMPQAYTDPETYRSKHRQQ